MNPPIKMDMINGYLFSDLESPKNSHNEVMMVLKTL